LGIADDHVLVLNLGRICREKGLFELLQAVSLAAAKDSRITCVIVGSSPAFDETLAIQRTLDEAPSLRQKTKLLPACHPDKVWEYLCAADIFAFTSHQEGMPNSLLEAMAMGLPAIAFAIPPVVEIEAGSGGIYLVQPFDTVAFAEAMVRLASTPDDRVRLGATGKGQVMDRFLVQKNMVRALDHIAKVTCMQKVRKSFS
jgi:glycosyltransferase involved in cell wall biosynthesis